MATDKGLDLGPLDRGQIAEAHTAAPLGNKVALYIPVGHNRHRQLTDLQFLVQIDIHPAVMQGQGTVVKVTEGQSAFADVDQVAREIGHIPGYRNQGPLMGCETRVETALLRQYRPGSRIFHRSSPFVKKTPMELVFMIDS